MIACSGQVAAQMPHCTHRVSMKRTCGASMLSRIAASGHEPTQARHIVQASALIAIAPNGEPLGSAMTCCGTGACNAMWSSTHYLGHPQTTSPSNRNNKNQQQLSHITTVTSRNMPNSVPSIEALKCCIEDCGDDPVATTSNGLPPPESEFDFWLLAVCVGAAVEESAGKLQIKDG